MDNTPIASVCIPVYKVEPYVAQCIRSVLQQECSGLEIVVVNDGTPDRSMDIVAQLVAEENTHGHAVQLISLPSNKGLYKARQEAIRAARGKYLFFMDSDDYLTDKRAYRSVIEAMEASHEPMAIFDFTCGYKHRNKRFSHPNHRQGEEAVAALIDGTLPGYLWNKCFRRELFLPLASLMEKEITLWEDKNVVIPYGFLYPGICYVEGSYYYYRCYMPDSMSNTPSATALHSIYVVQERMKQFFDKHPHSKVIDEALQYQSVVVKLIQYKTDDYRAFCAATQHYPISRREASLLRGASAVPYRLMAWFNRHKLFKSAFALMRTIQGAKTLL